MTDPRSVSDAAHLTLETDASLRAMVEAPVGEVSETTRVLAGLELEARGAEDEDPSYDRTAGDPVPDEETTRRGRAVDSFEGHGDFNSSDPFERYAAHQAAKGH